MGQNPAGHGTKIQMRHIRFHSQQVHFMDIRKPNGSINRTPVRVSVKKLKSVDFPGAWFNQGALTMKTRQATAVAPLATPRIRSGQNRLHPAPPKFSHPFPNLHRPFANLPRRLGGFPRRSVSFAEFSGNLPEWFGNLPQPARNLHAWFSNLPRPAGNLPERFRKPVIYLPILDKHVPNQ